MRKSTTYNKVVNYNREENEVTILEDIFEYYDNMKGATGTVYEIITKDKYTERLNEYLNNPEAVADYWKDVTGENLSYKEVIAIANDEGEIRQVILGIDFKPAHLGEIRKELNLSEDNCYVITFVSAGRCFDKNFQGNVNAELSEIIRTAES